MSFTSMRRSNMTLEKQSPLCEKQNTTNTRSQTTSPQCTKIVWNSNTVQRALLSTSSERECREIKQCGGDCHVNKVRDMLDKNKRCNASKQRQASAWRMQFRLLLPTLKARHWAAFSSVQGITFKASFQESVLSKYRLCTGYPIRR